jgi:hypothetical protein
VSIKPNHCASPFEPFSSWGALLFDVLEDEDRGEQGGGSLWAAVQLGQ